jgi:hypothetical protein
MISYKLYDEINLNLRNIKELHSSVKGENEKMKIRELCERKQLDKFLEFPINIYNYVFRPSFVLVLPCQGFIVKS